MSVTFLTCYPSIWVSCYGKFAADKKIRSSQSATAWTVKFECSLTTSTTESVRGQQFSDVRFALKCVRSAALSYLRSSQVSYSSRSKLYVLFLILLSTSFGLKIDCPVSLTIPCSLSCLRATPVSSFMSRAIASEILSMSDSAYCNLEICSFYCYIWQLAP